MFFRSVELGRSTVRAANTGISVWIDARGRVHQATGLYQDAVVVADVLAYVVFGFWRRRFACTSWAIASFCLYWQQLTEAQHTSRLGAAVLGLILGCRAFKQWK